MRCYNCQHVIPPSSKFCAYCGVPQGENAAYHHLVTAQDHLGYAVKVMDTLSIWVPQSRNSLQPALDAVAIVRGELGESLLQGRPDREQC